MILSMECPVCHKMMNASKFSYHTQYDFECFEDCITNFAYFRVEWDYQKHKYFYHINFNKYSKEQFEKYLQLKVFI